MAEVDEKAELAEILAEDWRDLADEGVEIDGYETVSSVDGDSGRWMTHVTVVTKTPKGRYFEWKWERGNTEFQEHIGPAEYGDVELVEVERKVEIIEVTKWVKKV